LNLLSPGEILCRARKEKGLAAEEIMMHLGITHRTFNALEHDEYDLLPSPLYVKGYIKRYCSILGISDTEALSSFDVRVNELGLDNKKEPIVRLQDQVGGRAYGRRVKGWKFIIPIVLAIVLVIVVGMFFSGSGDEPLPTDMDVNSTSLSDDVTNLPSANNKGLVNGAESAIQDMPEASTLVSHQEGTVEGSSERVAGNTIESDKGLTQLENRDVGHGPDVTAAQIADKPMATVSIAADANGLQIKVTQQSWIEILDAKGDILLADLKTSGYKGEVKGMAPFDVILGYAPGVELTLNGKRVEMPAIENDNTAKLKIGDKEKG
jgi:cytoskeleton protein RodZ